MSASKDYIAMWFDVRKELGINDDMSIGRVCKEEGSIQWEQFSHSQMDGVGGVATVLRKHGYPCKNLPTSSEKAPPSLWQLYKLAKEFKKNNEIPPKSIKWKTIYPCSNDNSAPIESHYFTSEETALIKKNAKKNKVAYSTFLMWSLNKAIADNLLEKDQHYYWFYPVNLRGAVQLSSDTSNYSSGINACLHSNMTPKELQQEIKIKLKTKEYWSTWKSAHIGKYVGKTGVRYIYNKISQKNFYAGSFSFLGSWPLKEDRAQINNQDEVWVTCGIGTKNYPVSTGIMEWNGQLTLGLKLHPMICQDIAVTQKCLNDWKHNLTEDKNHNDLP